MSKKLIALCACPMGLAHTFMAAQALEEAAVEAGYEVKIETQGADGIQNRLTAQDTIDGDISGSIRTPWQLPRKITNVSNHATFMKSLCRTQLKTLRASSKKSKR